MKAITRTVWILSFISLFNDAASELLIPVMPIYLKQIGFSVLLIGVLEGLSEAIAGLSKGYFGQMSDLHNKRVPFVRLGYAMSAASKPLLAVSVFPLWVFFTRALDRLGKGIRTGARDAVLSAEATPATKGKVFGFHRSMDTVGAIVGPAVALIYLHYHPGQYRSMFLLALIPGILAVLSAGFLKEKKVAPPTVKPGISFLSFAHYWRTATADYRALCTLLLLFTFFNSSDAFLLLELKQSGMSDERVIMMYIFYNLIYAISSYPMGWLADRMGLKGVLVVGLLMFSGVYTGMAFGNSWWVFVVLFFFYGLYAAATEGISKAWISNLCAKSETATAIGTFTAFQSVMAILASSFAGLVWTLAGPTTIFLISGISVAVIAIVLWMRVPYQHAHSD